MTAIHDSKTPSLTAATFRKSQATSGSSETWLWDKPNTNSKFAGTSRPILTCKPWVTGG